MTATTGERRVRWRLPEGRSLAPEAWRLRHRGILLLLALHAAGLYGFGVLAGQRPTHALFESAIVAGLALLAAVPRIDRRLQSILASFGLMSASAILVHFSGGYIEAHFHFFVMLGVIFLYEDWMPYVLAVGYVAIHHGVLGSIDPLSVYNHPAAFANPWQFALIHALFILGLSAALLVAWYVIDGARVRESVALAEAADLRRQLTSQEKLAALGSLAAGLAHEVRTPLTVVSANATILESAARKDRSDLREVVLTHASEIQASVDRLNTLVTQLKRFHALRQDELRESSLSDLVREAVRLFASANAHARRISTNLGATPPSLLDELGVHQIVFNLLLNAVEATRVDNGRILVETRVEGDHALLVVADNGHGMDDHVRASAFQPLFTTKTTGMGLGLHIVKRIVEAQNGDITFTTEKDRGTTFRVRFPLTPAAAPTPRPAPALEPSSTTPQHA